MADQPKPKPKPKPKTKFKPKSKIQRVVKPNECYSKYEHLFDEYEPYTPTNELKEGEGNYYLRKKKFS